MRKLPVIQYSISFKREKNSLVKKEAFIDHIFIIEHFFPINTSFFINTLCTQSVSVTASRIRESKLD